MPYFNIVAESNKNTVVTEYEPVKTRSDQYQSEAALEQEFIRLLADQGYTYLPIHKESDLVSNIRAQLDEPQIVGEQKQKDFIALFGQILRMRNLLISFDDFEGNEIISEWDMQDYLGRYQDLRDEWKRKRENGESTDITDDIVEHMEIIQVS